MSARARFGVTLKNFGPEGEPLEFEHVVASAELAESLDLSSVWVWDHILLGSRRPFPFLESLSVLAGLAARTDRVSLGTGILVLALREPVALSKTLSTIDVMSGGRLVLGAAAGWYEKEFHACGIPFKRRGKVFLRNLEILKRFWTERSVTGEAEGVRGEPGALQFRNAVMLPKPVSRPHPPVLLGGYVDRVLRRVAEHADGWLTYLYRPESFVASWRKIARYAQDAGRDPATLRNVSQVPICVADSYEEARRRADEFIGAHFDVPEWSDASPDSAICGTVEQCAEQAAAHLEAGVQELVFMPYNYSLEQVEVIGKELLPRLREIPVGSPA